jgi:hypothetical protein
MKHWLVIALLSALNLAPIYQALSAPADPWQGLGFLEGTWEARTQAGSAGAKAAGTYTFKHELKDHVLARYSVPAACEGPKNFDCEHGDVLYVYQEAQGQPLNAIYFDNEGHVIHYAVSTPDSATAVFLSDASPSGPQFQLVYQLKGAIMLGKFQMRMPGQQEWKSYLEWSGAKR